MPSITTKKPQAERTTETCRVAIIARRPVLPHPVPFAGWQERFGAILEKIRAHPRSREVFKALLVEPHLPAEMRAKLLDAIIDDGESLR